MRKVRNEKGVTVIAAVATLMVLSLMGTVVVSLVGIENYSALHQAQTLEAHWIAEAGIQRALTYMSREDGTCPPPPSCTTTPLFSNVPLGRGTSTFTVTACRYLPSPTGLSADITAVQTTITVPSGNTTGFAPRGRIAIESELIAYTGTTATQFTGAKRGMDGTTAAAHTVASGAAVSQYQCTIVSTGTVSAGLGDAKRVVEAVVQ
ncbi:MAG: hypothetical protein ACREKF_11850 [Candidatus Methylomirabilales bacterium]